MAIGQGAGIAGALAAKTGATVQEIPYAQLRSRLLAQRQALELPAEGKSPLDLQGIGSALQFSDHTSEAGTSTTLKRATENRAR